MSKASKEIKRAAEAANRPKTGTVHIKLENWLRGTAIVQNNKGGSVSRPKKTGK